MNYEEVKGLFKSGHGIMKVTTTTGKDWITADLLEKPGDMIGLVDYDGDVLWLKAEAISAVDVPGPENAKKFKDTIENRKNLKAKIEETGIPGSLGALASLLGAAARS